MWKKIAFVAGFIALMFLADRVLALALSRLVLASNARVSALYDGRVEADVVLIGNSRAVHMASAPEWSKALCRPVFNLSLNGLDVATQDALVRDFLDRNPAPRVMAIEISNLFSDTFMAPEYRPFIGESDRLSALIPLARRPGFRGSTSATCSASTASTCSARSSSWSARRTRHQRLLAISLRRRSRPISPLTRATR